MVRFVLALLCACMFWAAPARADGIVRDTEIETTLKSWAAPVFGAAGMSSEQVNLVLVDSSDVNAFVAGGANIFVYTGLILKADNAEEVTGVIAHEMGHMAGGHLIGGRMAFERSSFESILATVIGLGLGVATGNPTLAIGIAQSGQATAQSTYFAHSRMQESSADQAGMRFMRRAGISPVFMESFMRKLADSEALPQDMQQSYARTHPDTGARAQTVDATLSDADKAAAPNPKLKPSFERIKAKLVGFTQPARVQWVYDDKDDSFPARYARAVAVYKQGDAPKAAEMAKALLQDNPHDAYVLELLGQFQVEAGDVEAGITSYRKAIAALGDAPLIRIALAEALIAKARNNGDKAALSDARAQLDRASVAEGNDPHIYRLMGTIYGINGDVSGAAAYLSNESLLLGRYEDARAQAGRADAQLRGKGPAGQMARDVLAFLEQHPDLLKDKR